MALTPEGVRQGHELVGGAGRVNGLLGSFSADAGRRTTAQTRHGPAIRHGQSFTELRQPVARATTITILRASASAWTRLPWPPGQGPGRRAQDPAQALRGVHHRSGAADPGAGRQAQGGIQRGEGPGGARRGARVEEFDYKGRIACDNEPCSFTQKALSGPRDCAVSWLGACPAAWMLSLFYMTHCSHIASLA